MHEWKTDNLQRSHHDCRTRERSFLPHANVYVHRAGINSPWIPGMVEERQGTVHYDVRLEDGRQVKRHIDHMQPRTTMITDTAEESQEDTLEQIDSLHWPLYQYNQSNHQFNQIKSSERSGTIKTVYKTSMSTRSLWKLRPGSHLFLLALCCDWKSVYMKWFGLALQCRNRTFSIPVSRTRVQIISYALPVAMQHKQKDVNQA